MRVLNYARVLFKKKCILIYIIFILLSTIVYLLHFNKALDNTKLKRFGKEYFKSLLNSNSDDGSDKVKVVYDCLEKARNSEIIFVGGSGRSGTTLMRAILDAHPDMGCGPETKIIQGITSFVKRFAGDTEKQDIVENAGFSFSNLNNALSLFIHHALETRELKSNRKCVKDPDIVFFINYLLTVFPRAKFVYMVRDARDVAYSMIKQLEMSVFKFEIMQKYLKEWNTFNMVVNRQCQERKNSCIMVKYEELIENPKENILKVANFLNLSWTDDFLRHEELIDTKIAVSDFEWSSSQIKKPIYRSSVRNWIGKIKNYDGNLVRNEIFMLKEFGYDLNLK